MENVIFSQRFPFTEKAKEVLKEMNISIDEVPEQAIRKAALMVSRANSKAGYSFEVSAPTEKEILTEIMAFPISKIFVSLITQQGINEKFSALLKRMCFENIVNNEKPKEICFSLLDDFNVKYDILEEDNFFVSLALIDYLDTYFVDEELKLVNKIVSGGKVFLTINDCARFLSEKAYKKTLDSLPIKKESIPKIFYPLAKSIELQMGVIEKKNFDLKVMGKINPEFFPPSFKQLYADQLAGKKLSYFERLALGSFLFQLGMQKNELLVLFSKSPDFKKHIAEYHVNRIFEKEISAPGYKKMNDYGIIISKEEKSYKHPLQYYLAQMRLHNRMKNKGERNVSN